MQTQYRSISDGYTEFLQYLSTKKYFFGVITKSKWSYIWFPYFDVIWGRSLDTSGYNGMVCLRNNKFEEFKSKWPNIEDYFKWADEEQKKLEKVASDYHTEIEKKKGKVREV